MNNTYPKYLNYLDVSEVINEKEEVSFVDMNRFETLFNDLSYLNEKIKKKQFNNKTDKEFVDLIVTLSQLHEVVQYNRYCYRKTLFRKQDDKKTPIDIKNQVIPKEFTNLYREVSSR